MKEPTVSSVELYRDSDNRTAALRQYERCATALRTELSVEPSSRTEALIEQVRTSAVAEVGDVAPAARPVGLESRSSDSVLSLESHLAAQKVVTKLDDAIACLCELRQRLNVEASANRRGADRQASSSR